MELKLYSTIEYTAGWYYRNYPGFYNTKCYKILVDYSHNPKKYVIEEGVEESKEEEQEQRNEERHNKKIRLQNNINHGLQSEY